MNHGGAREGSGRRRSGPNSVQVNWRVSENAKAWIVGKAKEQGVSVARIVDELIKSFEEMAKGAILLQGDQSKITIDFKTVEMAMRDIPDRNGVVFSQPRKILDEMMSLMNDNSHKQEQ